MLKQKILLSYYANIIAQVFAVISGIVVARLAGPTVMGTLAFGMSFVLMFKFVTTLGLNTSHIKLLSGGEDAGKCNATFAFLKSGTILLFVLVLFINYTVQTKIFKVKFETPEHKWIILIWVLIVVVDGIISIPRSTFIARVERAKVDVTALLRTILQRLIRMIVAAVGLGAVYLALSNLIVLVLFVPLYFWLFRKIEFSKFNWDLAKKYFKISFPIILIGIFSSLNQYIDKIFLQYATNTNEVGYYSVGFTFSRPVLLLGTAVSAMFFPVFSKLFSENKTNQIKELVAKFDRFLFLFVFPFIILFMIYSPTIVPLLLGEQYVNSVQVVSLISLSMFIYILQLPYGNMIFGLGKFKQAAIIQFMNLILLMVFLIILVSEKYFYLGANGNAIAILLTNLSLLILTFLTMKKYIKDLKFFYDRKITIAYIVIFGLLYFLYKFLSLNQLNFLLYVYPFFFIFFVFGLMTLMNLITKKDWRQFFSFFKIKDLVSYVKKEFKE